MRKRYARLICLCLLVCTIVLAFCVIAVRQKEQARYAAIISAEESVVLVVPPSSSVGAYYPCGRSAEVARPVLRRFHRAYPGAPVLLHDDHGRADIAALAAEEGAAYMKGVSKSWTGHASFMYSIDAMMDYMDGAVRVAEEPGVRWVALLEDDVAFLRNVDVDAECAECDVCCAAIQVPSTGAEEYLLSHFTMQGGCFIRSALLTHMAGTSRGASAIAFERSRDVSWWRHIPSDVALTLAAAAANATFGSYSGRVTLHMGEGSYALERAVKSGEASVVHGIKSEYPVGIWMLG